MIVAPGTSFSTASAKIASSWSPQITRPSPSIAPMWSPSPSKATPKSRPFFRDERAQVGEVLLLGRVGVMVGEVAVDIGEQRDCSPGSSFTSFSTTGPAAPLPASQPIRNALAVEALDQPRRIAVHDLEMLTARASSRSVAARRHGAELLDVGAEKRAGRKTILKPL